MAAKHIECTGAKNNHALISLTTVSIYSSGPKDHKNMMFCPYDQWLRSYVTKQVEGHFQICTGVKN